MISSAKKFVLLLSAAVCLISCNKEIVLEEPVQPAIEERVETDETIEYHINASCTETKTAMSGKSVVWSSGDMISVAYQHDKARKTAIFKYEGENSFVSEILTPDDGGDWYAIYPSSVAGEAGNCINLPAESVQQGNSSMAHLAGEGFPLWGKALAVAGSDVPHIQMEQVATVVNFNITNQEDSPIKVSKVIFTAPVEIAGKFAGPVESGHEWTPATGKATKTAVLNVNGGEAIAPGASASFYMGMMPFSATGNFSITVMAESEGKQIYSTKNVEGKTMAFKAGSIGKINYKFVSSLAEETKSYYVKVTSDPGAENWSGQYLIVNTGDEYAFSTRNRTASKFAITVKDGKIESTDEVDLHALTISGGTSSHKKSGGGPYAYDVKNTDGDYVFYNSGGMRIKDSNYENSGNYQCTIVLDGSGVQIMSAKNSSSSGSSYYITYSNNAFTYDKTSSNRVFLYKKDDTMAKPGQSLQFESSRVVWTVGDEGEFTVGQTYNLPQLATGAQTFVTYTSSNTEVADIVGNSQVKIVGTGITTITATAAESTVYSSASASFTLSIREPGNITESNLGNFELDNDYIKKYLLDADASYADDGSNWSTYSIVTNYTAGSTQNSFDRPKPVRIPVSEADGSNVTVEIYNDAQRTDEELIREYTISDGYAEVYNLIPNDEYWYTVISEGEEIDRGTFTTSGLRRYLTVSSIRSNDHANNLRDFGGQKTEKGKTLRYNLIFRGTNMDGTTEEEQDWIINYMNVRRDVDLRSKSSHSTSSSYANRPLPEIVEYTNGNISNWEDITNAKMQNIFSGIANTISNGDACYIHCYVGADRTGYISILINAICGVSEKDCTIDFELTSFSCVGRRSRTMTTYGYNDKGLKLIESQDGDTFQQKAINTLLGYGVPQSDIDTIINTMVN